MVRIERADRRRVLQGRARHFERLDDAGFEHVDELAAHRVEALAGLGRLDALHFNRTLEARVLRDLAERLLESALDDVDADLLVVNRCAAVGAT